MRVSLWLPQVVVVDASVLCSQLAGAKREPDEVVAWDQRRPTQEARELATGSGQKVTMQGLEAAGLKQQGY